MLTLTPFVATYAQVTDDEKETMQTFFTNSLNGKSGTYSANRAIDNNQIATVRAQVWEEWRNSVNNFDEEKLIPIGWLEDRNTGSWTLPSNLEPNATMPYYWGANTSSADEINDNSKFPLFLYMHGSGDKASEWETGIGLALRRFYSPGVYMVPQIPNGYGEYYRWAIQSKQWAWEKLLRLSFLEDKIDPNRIYFFGISEGGYGSQRLAAFYADYLAGAGPMAGGEPLKNAPMENVANIAFSLRTGALDDTFLRNRMTEEALAVADSLEAEHPGYYKHFIEVIPDYGHSIDYRPTTPWLAQFTRNPHPKYVYWENFDMYGRYRKTFYNIKVNKTSRENSAQRSCYEMSIDNNTITLNVKNVRYKTTYTSRGIEFLFSKSYTEATLGNITLYLNEELFDLEKPVKVILNGTEIFNERVGADLATMVESCALFYDPERVFPAAIEVDIASKSAQATSVKSVVEKKNDKKGAKYNVSGQVINTPSSGQIYINNGKKYLSK